MPISPGSANPWMKLVCFAVLASVSGCGADDGIGQRYSVRGKVTYKGEPVTKGTVGFVPMDSSGRAAIGEIQPDGSYTLTTLIPLDGALPGKYRVSVSAV